MNPNEKADLKNEMANILLKDEIFRLEFFRKLLTSSEVNIKSIKDNIDQLSKLKDCCKRYKDLQKTDNNKNLIKSIEKIVKEIEEAKGSIKTDEVDNSLVNLNSKIKLGTQNELDVFYIIFVGI